MAKKQVKYDESTIQTLDALEHIRLRTGMYIGRVGDGTHPQDGVYVLLKEVVDNAVDEFIMGEGKTVEVSRVDHTITVRDYGRGIPLGKVVDCVSKINTGGKYNDDVFQFSVGLNGVGTKAVNALSAEFAVTSWRDGKFLRAEFARGRLVGEKKGKDASARNGTLVEFTPDPEIFGTPQWNDEFLDHRFRYYAHLNTGLRILYNGSSYISKQGVMDLLGDELGDEIALYDILHVQQPRLEFAFTHTHTYGENYYSFVNGQHTNDGGTHESAFREGLLKGVNEFAGKSFAGPDVRDGIIGAVAIKMQDPIFESQTKNKLGSTDIRGWIVQEVKDNVVLRLHENPTAAEELLTKVRANERVRKELSAVKKAARERAKKVAIRIPKLIDCKVHYNDEKAGRKDDRRPETSLFLTEGDSAGGAMVQARDVATQAIFCMRGKPLNCHGMKRDTVYKNEELYNMMQALGIEDDLDGLRYNRVVIATDADVDGMHIRNLLLTYFLHYFEELVLRGHLYILETPLFRVRDKSRTVYCFDEAERDAAMAEITKPEITRFKGLGEINPKEFTRFIGREMRLKQVNVPNKGVVQKTLEFYMGKNTPERRKFIVDELISEPSW
ncbi:MAG: DNA topoisomerase IV subunit B [Planctomycetota bacterium]|nr:DNA topoisomerase IV subunit B [Planctomycetota bacterium]